MTNREFLEEILPRLGEDLTILLDGVNATYDLRDERYKLKYDSSISKSGEKIILTKSSGIFPHIFVKIELFEQLKRVAENYDLWVGEGVKGDKETRYNIQGQRGSRSYYRFDVVDRDSFVMIPRRR